MQLKEKAKQGPKKENKIKYNNNNNNNNNGRKTSIGTSMFTDLHQCPQKACKILRNA